MPFEPDSVGKQVYWRFARPAGVFKLRLTAFAHVFANAHHVYGETRAFCDSVFGVAHGYISVSRRQRFAFNWKTGKHRFGIAVRMESRALQSLRIELLAFDIVSFYACRVDVEARQIVFYPDGK